MRTLVILFGLLVPSVAYADAVGPPPPTCPEYGMATTCHVVNGYCAPNTCASDAVCTGGAHCQPTPECIATVLCGGRTGMPSPMDELVGSCPTGACPSGSTCQMRSACVGGTAVDSGTPDGGVVHSSYGCCSVAGTRGALGGVLLALAVIALALQRRRSF